MKAYKRNLSIIIPHYNTPDLLQKLIDSIPHIADIQIIVVDDNSDTQTDTLKALQVKYNDVVEFYQNDTSTKSAGTCRNIGLQHADGKWILFADADDFFVEGMYEAVSQYFESDYDEIFFTPTSIYLDTGALSNRHCLLANCIDNYISNPTWENELKLKIKTCSPWSKLIRHEIITKYDIYFDEILYSNDVMFTVKSGYYSQKITASKAVIYCITRSNGSLTTHVSWNSFEIRLEEYVKVCDFIAEHYSRKELKTLQYTCLVKLYTALQHHFGLKRYLYIVKLFYKHNIPMFTWRQIASGLKNLRKNQKIKQSESRYYINGR